MAANRKIARLSPACQDILAYFAKARGLGPMLPPYGSRIYQLQTLEQAEMLRCCDAPNSDCYELTANAIEALGLPI